MVKQTKSKNQLEKQRVENRQRCEKFFIKKDEQRDAKGSMARQAALDKLGIKLSYDFEDHKKDYNYAQERAPFNQAPNRPPIKMIDASIDPSALKSYPEYPIREYSSPPTFNVAVVKFAFKAAPEMAINAAAFRTGLCRAKATFHASQLKGT